ncbi:MAG: ABC transporter permease [Deltaproteobacteria bacterium]|nr:MAG: ABC transporter permease [Deltaproteobacteria bacterium]
MGTLFKIAWRNIWRNTRRTVILVLAIGIGLMGIIVTEAFMNGMENNMVQNIIRSSLGHIQIYAKGFDENPVVERSMGDSPELLTILDNHPGIKNYSRRIRAMGLISNPEHSRGVMIVGIEPSREPHITYIEHSIVDGRYLREGDTGRLIVGKKLADEFELELGSKVVLMAQDLEKDIASGAYRVVGIFRTDSSEFDKATVFITLPDARKLLSLSEQISKIVIVVNDLRQLVAVAGGLRTKLEFDLMVHTWEEIEPVLVRIVELYGQFTYIVYLIVFVAMAFGIINTMLMVIFERVREMGVMMALGIRPIQIVLLVILETVCIGIVGLCLGNLLGAFFLGIFHNGMDLSFLAEGMEYWGMSHIIFPSIGLDNLLIANLSTIVTAIIISIYPAIRAARFRPVEALRHH